MTDIDKIRNDAATRKIRRLCHFTQSRKLPHILGETEGIYSSEWLQNNRVDIFDKNDPLRLDGLPNYISCSIEYPNTWYLNNVKPRDFLFKDWCVLLIKPDVLWSQYTRFAYRNAAALKGYLKGGFESYYQIFAPKITGAGGRTYKRGTKHLLSCPTDGQAEVLVFEKIPLELIFGLVFKDKEHAQIEIGRLMTLKIDVTGLEFYLASHFYDNSWRRSVEKGIFPMEEIYKFE